MFNDFELSGFYLVYVSLISYTGTGCVINSDRIHQRSLSLLKEIEDIHTPLITKSRERREILVTQGYQISE